MKNKCIRCGFNWPMGSFTPTMKNITLKVCDHCVDRYYMHHITELEYKGRFRDRSYDENTNVYFIVDIKSRAVKIGVSKEVTKRLKAIQASNVNKLHVIKIFKNQPKSIEKVLHDEFWEERIRGEWFCISVLNNMLDD